MGVSLKPTSSISKPLSSDHPTTQRMEELLKRFNNWESTLSSPNPSAHVICTGLSHLSSTYQCLEDVFKTNPFDHTRSNSTDFIYSDDVSVKFLDLCHDTTDLISRAIQYVRDFGCHLRRNGIRDIESLAAKYLVLRKKLKKDIKGSMSNLKKVERMICGCGSGNGSSVLLDSVFRDVAACTTVILRFVLRFLGVPVRKTNRNDRWKIVSRFLSGGKVVPEDKHDVNELQRLDAAVFRYSTATKKEEFIQILQSNVESFETTLEDINCHVELLWRRLIETRVSLLNMVSFH